MSKKKYVKKRLAIALRQAGKKKYSNTAIAIARKLYKKKGN